MADYIVLFNPRSEGGAGIKKAQRLSEYLPGDSLTYVSIFETGNLAEFFARYPDGTGFVVTGGDGTLNHFINHLKADEAPVPENLYYFPSGSGNDFINDIGGKSVKLPVRLNGYIKDLPVAEFGGRTELFINGIGCGMDGYVCDPAEAIIRKRGKKINYTLVALKALFGGYKPVDTEITADGNTQLFRRVWICPVMIGRFFGGGMRPAPDQDRNRSDGKLSLMVFYDLNRFLTLWHFPKLFPGKHVNVKNHCCVLEAYDFTLKFAKPVPVQLDGETFSAVESCHVYSNRRPD